MLTLGRVDRVRVQVGYRATPDGPAHEQFLLDLPVPEDDDAREADYESQVLAALEPVLYGATDAPRHYSLHQHRSHSSWGPSPGTLDIGLLVTTGTRTGDSEESLDGVNRAFHDLLELADRSEPVPTTRAAAVQRARMAAGTAYAVDPDTLSISAEQHHQAENSWSVRLHTAEGDEFDVVVGLVDGYAGSVRVRHEKRTEVFDSVGSE